MAPIKLEDSDDSDDGPAPTYFDMKVENPYQFSEKPLPVQGSSLNFLELTLNRYI